ncbi:MAG: glutathione S-transferase family protein [Halocynthiibacter sp.]
MYKLIGSKNSRAFRVLWLLEELGLEYAHEDVPPHHAKVLAANPAGKIPVFVDGDLIIRDSNAIMAYLADKHEAVTFPAGTPKRALQDSYTYFLLDEFDAALWVAARHSFVLPKAQRIPEVKDSLKWEFSKSQKGLVDRWGDGPYLMGDTFTIADILLAQSLNWAKTAKFDITEDRLLAYHDEMKKRPAYKRALSRKS